jgi:glutamate-5-semialdehyde dehydrogenase
VSIDMRSLAVKAKAAAGELLKLDSQQKNSALRMMADGIRSNTDRLQSANQQDLENGKKKGLTNALLDRLTLTDARIESMAKGLEEIAQLKDPVGEIVSQWHRPGGFEVGQMRIPLGVIGIIYEARPNVTADAAGLCFKAGNATILRGDQRQSAPISPLQPSSEMPSIPVPSHPTLFK